MWESRTRSTGYRPFEHDTSGTDAAATIFRDSSFRQRLRTVDHSLEVSEVTREADLGQSSMELLKDGADFNRLVETHPDNVISILRDHAVQKVAEFKSNDPVLLHAFRDRGMVTSGFDSIEMSGLESTWQSILADEGKSKIPIEAGWHETMCLVAYCVNIKRAANVLGGGILRPLLTKEKTGDSGDEVWDFPSVRAVIEFKWMHWARRYLIFEFILYLGWLLSFVGFMAMYIEKNLDKGFQHDMDAEDRACAVVAYVLDIASLVFMLPFLVIEYNSVMFYKWQWIQMWNLFDASAYILQVLVSFFHFTHLKFGTNFYVTLLTVHCTILFVKVQYFARVMGPRASYVETLKTLIYNVRYFLLFICLSMVSAALSFSALYKWEIDVKEDEEDFNEDLEAFSSLPKSVVTAYSVLLGNFESSYVFETENRVVKGTYFLIFQLMMSITVLNLLIAVITESYTNTMAKESIMYNRGRAQIIDELELSLPAVFYPQFKQYVHFIVCEKPKKLEYELSALASRSEPEGSDDEMKAELRGLKDMITVLQKEVERLHEKIQ